MGVDKPRSVHERFDSISANMGRADAVALVPAATTSPQAQARLANDVQYGDGKAANASLHPVTITNDQRQAPSPKSSQAESHLTPTKQSAGTPSESNTSANKPAAGSDTRHAGTTITPSSDTSPRLTNDRTSIKTTPSGADSNSQSSKPGAPAEPSRAASQAELAYSKPATTDSVPTASGARADPATGITSTHHPNFRAVAIPRPRVLVVQALAPTQQPASRPPIIQTSLPSPSPVLLSSLCRRSRRPSNRHHDQLSSKLPCRCKCSAGACAVAALFSDASHAVL